MMNVSVTVSPPLVEAIFIAEAEGKSLRRVVEVEAVQGKGLRGDRYATGCGHFSGRYDCQVTMIEGEVLDRIEALDGINVHHGEHRRNIVTRGIALRDLCGMRLRIGEVLLEFECPRPPCSYVEKLTQPGMTRALGKGAGIGVKVLESGMLYEGAVIEVLPIPGAKPRRVLP